MVHRPELHLRISIWDHRRRMAVHNRTHLRPRLIDFAVNEAFEVHRAATLIDRRAVEVVFEDVLGRHQCGRHAARHQVAVRILVVPRADMAKAIHDALVVQNMIGRHEVIDQRRISRTG